MRLSKINARIQEIMDTRWLNLTTIHLIIGKWILNLIRGPRITHYRLFGPLRPIGRWLGAMLIKERYPILQIYVIDVSLWAIICFLVTSITSISFSLLNVKICDPRCRGDNCFIYRLCGNRYARLRFRRKRSFWYHWGWWERAGGIYCCVIVSIACSLVRWSRLSSLISIFPIWCCWNFIWVWLDYLRGVKAGKHFIFCKLIVTNLLGALIIRVHLVLIVRSWNLHSFHL